MSSDQDTPNPVTPDVQGAETTAAPAVQEQKDYKEDLVKELMSEAKAEPTVTEPVKPTEEPKAEEPAKEPETPAKEEVKKVEESEPAATQDEEDPELTGPGPDAPHGQKVAWGKLKAQNKQLREEGQFGHILAQVGASAGISPDDMANWVGLRARINSGDPAAVNDLMRMVGYNPQPMQPSTPAQKPVDQAEVVYNDMFADSVKSMDMTEEAARAKAKVIAERYHPAQAPQQVQQQQPARFVDPVERVASQELDRIDVEMSTKVSKWAEIRKEVFETIATKYQGAPPIRWVPIFNEVAREVQAKYTKPVAPPKVKATETLRPSTISTASASTNYKADLVNDLMAGRL